MGRKINQGNGVGSTVKIELTIGTALETFLFPRNTLWRSIIDGTGYDSKVLHREYAGVRSFQSSERRISAGDLCSIAACVRVYIIIFSYRSIIEMEIIEIKIQSRRFLLSVLGEIKEKR